MPYSPRMNTPMKMALPQKAGSAGRERDVLWIADWPIQNSSEITQLNSIWPMARMDGLEPALNLPTVRMYTAKNTSASSR